jgi:exonuclease VII small subunit
MIDSDDIEVLVDKQDPAPPTLRDPSLAESAVERTVDDLTQEASEDLDFALRQVEMLGELIRAIEQADACKERLSEAQDRVRLLRDELKGIGVLS